MHPIKHLRKEVLKISQSELGDAAGVTQATVSRWESGELEPSLSELRAIAAKFPKKVDLNALCTTATHCSDERGAVS
jgi:predicted transcriptional regulator